MYAVKIQGLKSFFPKILYYRAATLSGMSGIVRNLRNFARSQENVRKLVEFAVMSGKCQEFLVMSCV